MPPTTITAVAESDDILRCDPGPLARFLRAGAHLWSPAPGRVVLWRDDVEGEPAATFEEYWRIVLANVPEMPYLALPGGRCVTEMYISACGPGAARMVDGIAVVDALVAHATLEEWIAVIQRTGAEDNVDSDAVGHHVDAITAFLQNAVARE